MKHSFLSAFVLLLLVLDPFGALPTFISVLSRVPAERRVRVALRESAIAFTILLGFMLGGKSFLAIMHLSERSLEVAGGVILLIIAIRMIFSHGGELQNAGAASQNPLIFPLAVPLLAGPSAMATVLLLVSNQPEHMGQWIGAMSLAMAVSCMVLLAADHLHRWLGNPVVSAIEKLMGLVLCALAVEMILAGLKRYFFGDV
ncbi:MAG: MarC family protein [Burkholderiaceae bacterium]|nr:MarC family protein [Burkholderiaceae bacterium]